MRGLGAFPWLNPRGEPSSCRDSGARSSAHAYSGWKTWPWPLPTFLPSTRLKKINKIQHKLVNEREKWNGRGIRKINCTIFTTKRPVCTYKERHSGASVVVYGYICKPRWEGFVRGPAVLHSLNINSTWTELTVFPGPWTSLLFIYKHTAAGC